VRATGGARGSRLSALLAEPPLIDRLTWREGIHSPTLVSGDRGLMARTFGTLYLMGAFVTAASLVLPGALHDPALGVIAICCLLIGSTLFVVYRLTPIWVFQVVTALGSVLTALAAYTAGGGADAGYDLFYVWVVLAAFLFFDFRAAVLQTAFAIATYVVYLLAREPTYTANDLLGLVVVLGATGAVVGLLRVRLEDLAHKLEHQALTDPVTAIANRRSFESRFDFELIAADNADAALSLVICDLDRFKTVNDELGHEEGDGALRLAAATITGAVRSADVVFRMGGEEFAVLLPGTQALEAYAVAERIRLAVREAFVDFEVPVTVSCGLATRMPGGPDRDGLLRAADHALYHAKRAGRDRTVAHDPSIDEERAALPQIGRKGRLTGREAGA
jgi:diguanylate cyclase (GGDEF)-like protein